MKSLDDQNNIPQTDPQEPEVSQAPIEPVEEFVPPVVPENLEDTKEEVISEEPASVVTPVEFVENNQETISEKQSDPSDSVTPVATENENTFVEEDSQEEEIPSVEVGPEDDQDAQVISEEPIPNTAQTTLSEEKVETETIPAEENSSRPVGFKPKTTPVLENTGRPSGFTPKEQMASKEALDSSSEIPNSEKTAAPKIQWKKPVITMIIISAIAIGVMVLFNSMN